MKPARTHGRETADLTPTETSTGLLGGWTRFWFNPVDPLALHVLRIATGVLLLAWLLPLAGDVPALFGLEGWFDRQAYSEANRLPGGPPKPITWSLLYLCGNNTALLQTFYWTAIAILVLFTLGVATRLAAVLAWLVVASFTAVPAFDQEVDTLLLLLSFYLMVGYLLVGLRGGQLSWTGRILGSWRTFLLGRWLRAGSDPAVPSLAANLAVRLLQVHVAILIVTTGLHKLQFIEWWSGLHHWSLLHPALETKPNLLRQQITDPGSYVSWLNVMAYATLAWQIGFPLFAWRTGWWRLLLLGGAVAGWIGLATLYQAPLFGPALFIGCLAFLAPPEWHVLARLIQKVGVLRGVGSWIEEKAPAASRAHRELVLSKER